MMFEEWTSMDFYLENGDRWAIGSHIWASCSSYKQFGTVTTTQLCDKLKDEALLYGLIKFLYLLG